MLLKEAGIQFLVAESKQPTCIMKACLECKMSNSGRENSSTMGWRIKDVELKEQNYVANRGVAALAQQYSLTSSDGKMNW